MLTKKYVYGSLALAVMLACGSAQAEVTKYIDASAENYTSADDVNYTGNVNYGIYATAVKTVDLTGKNINFNISADDNSNHYVGVQSIANSNSGGGLVNLGGENTKNITLDIKHTGSKYAIGVWAHKESGVNSKDPSKIVVSGENFTINAHSDKNAAIGLRAQNCTDNKEALNGSGGEAGRSTIIVNAKNTVINVTSGYTEPIAGEYVNIGIMNYSQGKVVINNNLTINAGTAISTRGYAETKINEDGKGTVKINGDISFNVTHDGNSGLVANSTVNIKLTNKDSYLNGNIIKTLYGSPEGVDMTVNNMNMTLENGGTWNTNADSFVNNLTLDGGIINAKSEKQTITVDNLKGNGNVNLAATTDGSTINTSKITVEKAEEGSHLNANLTGITADDIKDVDKALESIKDNVTNVAHSNTITEGDINLKVVQNAHDTQVKMTF